MESRMVVSGSAKNAKAPGGHLLHNSSAFEQELSKRSHSELGPEVKPAH